MGLKPRLFAAGSDLVPLRQTVLDGLRTLAEGLPVEELPVYLGELAGGLETARWTAEARLRGRADSLPALLTVKDVAGMLQVDASTVTRWAAPGGRLSPAVRRLGEGTLRFDRKVLDRLIAS